MIKDDDLWSVFKFKLQNNYGKKFKEICFEIGISKKENRQICFGIYWGLVKTLRLCLVGSNKFCNK